MIGGSVVAAAVMTVILDPPDTTALVLTFGVILLAALVLSYGVGYLGLSWVDTAYPMPEPTSNPTEPGTEASQADRENFKWMIREGIGVAIASLFGLILLVLFLLEETALIQSQQLTVGDIGVLTVLFVLVLTLFVVGLWSWRGR
ncbi:hypothetical protein B2G88_16665 [Natronolimnobius baerhuensis]|uniref:Uncharacterized protein n=1 Tax=Natronolimnobius baerhuensis TaxID=253108 RepID=A0A202E4Y1_9EURY|nr:hypothetical protein B2G88_16665 [Natronolimnobius baerhuensis]